MKEIELLCRAGFLVLSYDHTGCMESGGDSPRGFSQSLYDLDDCIKAIKGDARFDGYDISVIGHSWGGFSTLNISAIHKEISHVVVLSGFVSASAIVASFFPGLLRGYRKPVMALEAATNPYYANFDGVSSIKKSAVKALLIYSDNDTLCSVSHYNTLKAGLCENENVTLRLEVGKGHNPNYTVGAVKYLGEYFGAKKKFLKSKKALTESEKAAFVKSFDWNKMTEQDGDVWEQIIAFLCDKSS
jgi:dipeptidyl aminopeptidase/acylaminoacyl peptidase